MKFIKIVDYQCFKNFIPKNNSEKDNFLNTFHNIIKDESPAEMPSHKNISLISFIKCIHSLNFAAYL